MSAESRNTCLSSLLHPAIHLGDLTLKPNLELDRVRNEINRIVGDGSPEALRSRASLSSTASSESSDPETEFRRSNQGGKEASLSADWCFIDCECRRGPLSFISNAGCICFLLSFRLIH